MLTAMDGCTGIPDIIAGISIRHCCDIHDVTLFDTTDWSIFDQANVAFAHCVWDAGLWWLALPFVFGPKRRARQWRDTMCAACIFAKYPSGLFDTIAKISKGQAFVLRSSMPAQR